MNEELDYGINVKGLPLIVVYPELTLDEIVDADRMVSDRARKLWNAVPRLEKYMEAVYTQHVPFDKRMIHEAHTTIDRLISGEKDG